MPELNEGITLASAAPEVRLAFEGGRAILKRLELGTQLYKLSGDSALPSRGAIGQPLSPWWCSVAPMTGTSDIGLDAALLAAQMQGRRFDDFVRENLAVLPDWNNSMRTPQGAFARIVRIQLHQPVHALHGVAARQQSAHVPFGLEPVSKRADLRGGGFQLWIPNLTSVHVTRITFHLV